MPRKIFDRELASLITQMTDMGNTVNQRIEDTIAALRTMDLEKAAEVATATMKLTGSSTISRKCA